MFKALMGGGGRSSSDVRSTASSSSKSSRRKTDSKSTSSRKSSRGDDRDRGLGDLSDYPPSASGSKRGPPSIAAESVASFMTAEPEAIGSPDRILERTPKRRDSDRDSKSSRRRGRDRSESRDRDRRRSSRRSTTDGLDDLDRERDRRERRRTQSGDVRTSNTPGTQFAADIAAPGFSQFPMQYDNPLPPASFPEHDSPHEHESSPSRYDPHVEQQFPGQFPAETAKPYFPPNPAGAAADYYGDQGQSVQHQPGVRTDKPLVIPNSQPHLMSASPSANPPPEPSSVGQIGAAASYFDEVGEPIESPAKPPSGSSSRPPKPSKPSSSSAIPAAGAAAATYGIGSLMSSHEDEESSVTASQHYSSYQSPAAASTSKPPQSHPHGIGAGVGAGAAAAAAGYMIGHHHHSSSPTNPHYTYQNYEHSSQGGVPPFAQHDAMVPGATGGYAAHIPNPGFYPHGTGSLAVRQRPRGPLSKFADFWRDPEGVGRFEDYTETIGVCKYCFQPGTSSLDAPRKHHYHRRPHSADRYSSSGSSRISKLNRYQSSEDEGRNRKRSNKSSSWLPGMLAGSLFAGKEFNDSYSVRSGRVAGDRSSYDGDGVSHSDRRSYTSRGVIRQSGRSSPRGYYPDPKHDRPRSRSSSRSRHSYVKEAALGAAVGGAALAASKSHQRTRSRSPSRIQRRKDSSSSSSFVDVSRPASKSLGGLASFFTSSSDNRKKKNKPAKKRRGFFSFNSSSSSSLDADLAFGSGFSKKPKSKQKKGKKGEDVDAALLGLGATATALAAASHGRRSTGQILTARESRSRHSNYASSANEDGDWVDADSEDQSASSVSSALAFGGSSSGSDSNGGGGWGWGWGSKKKKKKDRKSSAGKAAAAAGAGVLGGAALASVARHRDSRVSSSDGSLKHVYPVPTSDPSRFDATMMSPSVYPGGQPPLVRPGPIPLQQPQPVTPVSQSVYTTQGGFPGTIPAYSAPAGPPIFANDYNQYGPQTQVSRGAWIRDDPAHERRKPHRSDSSPVFPTQGSHVSSIMRRSTLKDQASVSFDLTDEQAERERRLNRRNKKSQEDFRDEPVQLIDREEESARRDSERRDRERRRKDREDEERRDAEKEKESSSSWAQTAAVGAIGAVAASSLVSRKSDDKPSEVSSRRGSERRRAERHRNAPGASIISQPDTPDYIEDIVVPEEVTEHRDKPSPKPSSPRSPRPAPVYEDYAQFYAPKELRHSPDEHSRSGSSHDEPNIVEVVPASEREPKQERESYDDLPQFAKEPYENRDQLPWPVPRLQFIHPTPPQSVNGSVRGASSPVVPPAAVVEETAEEVEHEIGAHERPSAGSRVSWGEHSTHEYEVPSSSEQEDVSPFEDSPSEGTRSKDVKTTPDFGTDVEFAATIAAGAAAAGFDPSLITDDPKYHTRTSPPGSEDEEVVSPRSKWDSREEPHGFVEGEIGSHEPDRSGDIRWPEHVIDEKPFVAEPEHIVEAREISPTNRRERSSIAQEAIEQLNGKHSQPDSPENDVFSMPGGFNTADNSREISEPHDDARSVFSAPVGRERDSTSRSRRSRRGDDDFELSRPIAPEVPDDADAADEKKSRRKHRSKRDSDTFSVDDDARSAITEIEDRDDAEKSERRKRRSKREGDIYSVDDDARSAITEIEDRDDAEKSERRKRRSKRESDTFSVDDDARSAITDIGDRDRSERRKHRHRSSRDKDFDDTASITSSPARIDETRDKRRSKDDKEKDKSSGSFLRNIFGSRVSAPEQHSRSSSLDKRSSREAMSEAGVDDERRRRKKRSSKHRSSSGGDKLDDYGSDKESVARDDMDLEEYRSSRQRKEERRRQKYEDIVDSGRRRESEKDEQPSDYNGDSAQQSFLEERPEMPAAAESDEHGDSGLESSARSAAIAAAGLALGGELIHQRPRSRSTSPPAVEKALDLAPKSQSRPSSPETSRENQSPHSRRMSTSRSMNESPTAVPLHFRRPPLSPSLQRATPVDSPTAESPGSPTQPRQRRPNSVEFRHSREIRPLWLVERHGSAKAEAEVDEELPSLPSSKTSSRVPSVEDLRTLNDEDAVRSWEPIDLSPSLMERRKAAGLSISTSMANEGEEDPDLLGSQQATPTAEDFEAPEGSAKKEKPRYEFHSPSELLRDPDGYPELPSSPTMDPLPSAEGSMVGSKGPVETQSSQEQDRGLDAQDSTPQPGADTPTQEKNSFFGAAMGAGFAGIVDSAVAAAVKGDEQPAAEDRELPTPSEDSAAFVDALETTEEPGPEGNGNPSGFADIVDAAVAAEVARNKAPVDDQIEEPVTAIEEQPPHPIEAAQPLEETTKELTSDSTELLNEPAQPQPAEEQVVDEPATTKSSKKKNKKKGKKGQASQSDPTTDPAVAAEDVPAVEATGGESRSIEPEATPAVEQEVVTQPEPASEPVETSRELDPESLPTLAPESTEAVTAPEVAPESAPVPAEPEVIEAADVPESQPESIPPADAPTEDALVSEQAEDTTGLSKKAKKKKQKKKGKNASISEPAEESSGPTEAAIPAEETQSEQKEISADVPLEAVDVVQGVSESDAPANQEISGATRDIVETAEPTPQEPAGEEPTVSSTQEIQAPTEDPSQPIEDSISAGAPLSEASELDLSQSAGPEAVEQPQPVSDAPEPTEGPSGPINAPDEAAPTEKPADPEDTFHEAVEEQPLSTEATGEIQPDAAHDLSNDASLLAETKETKAEEVPVVEPKKKGKKGKKNRKSVSVDEAEAPSEPKPASEPEAEAVSEEVKPEPSSPAEPTDSQALLASGETQPSETEQPVQDAPEQSLPEEPVASQDAELAPAADVGPVPTVDAELAPVADGEPTVSTESVEPTEQSRELPATDADAAAELEAEAQMTPAQRKKAKRDKKKKAKQSVSSIPEDEKPEETLAVEAEGVEPQPTEHQPTESADISKDVEAMPVDAAEDIAPVSEEVATDVAALEESKHSPKPEQPEEEDSKPDAVQNAPVEAAVEVPVESVDDAPVEGTNAEHTPVDPEVPMEKPEVEQVPTEAEIPLTAAQKKKAKKAKKKQQEQQQQDQQEAPAPVPQETQVEAVSAPEPESVESSKDATPAAEAETPLEQEKSIPTDVEPVDVAKDLDFAPQTEIPAAEDVPAQAADSDSVESKDLTPGPGIEIAADQDTPTAVEAEPENSTVEKATDPPANVEATESSAELAPVPENASAPSDAPQDDEKKDISLRPEPPQEDSSEVPAADILPSNGDADTPREEPEAEIESEANMTPAQKKKAKREKKKQQKRQSELLEAPPATEAESSSEQRDAEKSAGETTEIAPDENPSDPAEVNLNEEIVAEGEVSERKQDTEEAQPAAPIEPVQADSPTSDPLPPSDETSAEQAAISDAPNGAEAIQEDSQEPMSTDDAPSDGKLISDQPLEDPAASAEPPVEAPADEPTVPMSKKEKKKKKKRQSVAVEEEQQPEPVNEEPKPDVATEDMQTELPKESEASEPSPSETAEQSPAAEIPEGPATTDEAQPVEEPAPEESTREITASDQPTTEAEETPAEPEVPMTAAQKKKAKKDKKKQKSVAWGDEAPAAAADDIKPELESSAPTDNVESQDSPAAVVASSADGEQNRQTIEATESQDASEPEAPAVDNEVVSQEPQAHPLDESEAPLPTEASPAAETQGSSIEPGTSEPQKEEVGRDLEAEPPIAAITEEQSHASVEPPAGSDDKPSLSEDAPAADPETEEQAAEAGLSAKERRKLKKKEKKKGKSVDLTQEEPSASPEPSQEPEIAPESQADLPKADESENMQEQDAVISQPDSTEAPKDVIDSTETAESAPEAEKEDAPKTTEAEALSKESDNAMDKGSSETKDPDEKAAAPEPAVEDESATKDEEKAGDVAESEVETAMTAKERRKAKKDKKRQSKKIDADDTAATTEPANDSTLPEASAPDTLAEANETGAPDPSGPVTAPSPAEDDGKEHQSHDMPTPDTPAKDIASTDQFVSSQVEQPQLESLSSDYPPQPVPERDLDFGEKVNDDVQKEEVVVDVQEPELSNEPNGMEDGEVAEEKAEEGAPDAMSVQENQKTEEVIGENVKGEDESGQREMTEKEAVEETPVDMPTEQVPDTTTSVGEQVVEEPVPTALSKKQKKKDKKKKNQAQEEFKAEEIPPPELSAEPKQQLEDVPAVMEETGNRDIAEPEPVPESDPVPVVNDPSTEPTQHADASVPGPADDEVAVPETQQVEEAPLSRKLSKKEKKKQRQTLLAAEAEVEDKVEEQTSPETAEAPKAVQEPEDISPADDHEQQTTNEVIEPTLQASDDIQDALKEIDQALAGQDDSGKGVGQLEPAIESQPEETRADTEEATVPTQEIPPVESAPEQLAEDTKVELGEEQATTPKKMSKKEKKKAAAAAAAAAAVTEEKPSEPEPPAIENIDKVKEVDELNSVEPEREVPLDPVEQELNEQPPQESSEPNETTIEAPVEAPEESPDVPEAEAKQEEVKEDVAAEQSISRKMSKKEKRKAKKQGVQEPTGEKLEDSVKEAQEAQMDQLEDGVLTEPAAAEESQDTALESKTAIEETPADVSRELEPDVTEAPPATESEQLPVEDHPSDETRNEAAVPVDDFEASSSMEPKNQDAFTEIVDQSATGSLDQEPSPDQQDEQKQAEESKLEGQALEKAADLGIASDMLVGQPLEQEDAAPISRKMSKKEKRKAKKNGAAEELPSIGQEQEATLNPTPVEPQEEEVAVLAPEAEAEPIIEQSTEEPSASVDPESTKEVNPEESHVDVEPVVEPVVEPQPEPEEDSALSRKASKKKAKKAKKASQSLSVESAADSNAEKPEPALASEQETPVESKEVDVSGSATREVKHDDNDDQWPTIEWEHGKPLMSDKPEPLHESAPEPEPQPSLPVTETIGEFDESAIPAALQEAKKEHEKPVEEEARPAPLSKKDKKKAKKNKKKTEQPSTPDVEAQEESSDKKLELADESQPEAPKEIESEPPTRTLTPGGSKIANLFPGLERGGFRRTALDSESRSVKDSAEDETAVDLEANRDIAIPVSEAPQATIEIEAGDAGAESTESTRELFDAPVEQDTPTEDTTALKDETTEERELPVQGEDLASESLPSAMPPTAREQSPVLFGSPPSTRIDESSSSRQLLPSQMDMADESSCELQRTPSVIHGRHEQTPRTWNLEEPTIQAVRAPSPPRSLFGGPFEPEALARPRTPLDTIAEQESVDGEKGTTGRDGTPRLEVKPEHVLPRPITPVRKFTDNAIARELWPTPENEKARSLENLSSARGSPVLKTPEQGMPVLKPSSSKGKLRRTNRKASGDLRAVSQALDSQPPGNLDLDQLPSSSSYDPVTDKGKGPAQNMPDVFEAWGETPSSPRSPSRPPSVRRRRSMQHLQDIETRLDQLISENRLLIAARDEAENRLRNASVARRKSDQALNTRGADLRDKEAEVEQLKNSVEWLSKETTRLTQENEGLTASNAALAAAHAAEVHTVRESSTRELDDLRSQHTELSGQVDDRVRQEIQSALAQKDTELRRLRQELEEARDKVKELQQQISATVHDNALVFRDEDYFDAACQKLCGHVQQWVLRFSKHSDHRRCRALGELHDDKIADRFDNALLDGSDADSYLGDRVRRRDVFMSVVMTMVWEYIFTRYLFGMDREQRQKLKSLEKQLGEVGPSRAVHRWRATTLTLLSRRPAFASQRQSDTEAVALEIFGTLSRVLPPPTNVEGQLLESLRKVLRVAVNLSLEMRTQLAEFIMLPPLQPEYDTNGDLAHQVFFKAALMNERSGETTSNDDLESQQSVVRIVLFPLVVKKGNDVGEGDDEVVVCPAQVLVARPGKDKKVSRMTSGDRMSLDASRSVYSVAPSVAPSSMMDTSNVI